jgi:hypothetical protein
VAARPGSAWSPQGGRPAGGQGDQPTTISRGGGTAPSTPAARAAAAAGGGTGAQRYAPLRAPTGPPAGHSGRGASAAGGRRRRVPVVAAALAALAAVAAVLVFVVGGNEEEAPTRPNTVGERPAGDGGGSAPRVDRSQVDVAVLNGTTVQGLARGANQRLVAAGFPDGAVATDTTNQSRQESVVLYAEGERASALDAARVLRIPRSRVDPITSAPDGAGIRLQVPEGSDVVVVLGADKAQTSGG